MGKRRYRSNIEIIANMLEIAKVGSRKTRIMYLCNLSFDLLQKYLQQLQNLGLIDVTDGASGDRIYNITPKGQEFLGDFYELKRHDELAFRKRQSLLSTLRESPEAGSTTARRG
jgi:predicted transcriptional regulator